MNQLELLAKARQSLYKGYEDVGFNLDTPARIADLTLDVANATTVTTPMEEVEAALQMLNDARFVVHDEPARSIHYANLFGLKRNVIQYGDFQLPSKAPKLTEDEEMVYGVLAVGEANRYNLDWAKRYLNGMDVQIVELTETEEQEPVLAESSTTQSLEDFINMVDVLLVLAPNGTLVSNSLVLAFISVGVPVIASKSASLQLLDTSALFAISGNPTKKRLKDAMSVYDSSTKLNSAAERGKLYVKTLNDEAIARANRLIAATN